VTLNIHYRSSNIPWRNGMVLSRLARLLCHVFLRRADRRPRRSPDFVLIQAEQGLIRGKVFRSSH